MINFITTAVFNEKDRSWICWPSFSTINKKPFYDKKKKKTLKKWTRIHQTVLLTHFAPVPRIYYYELSWYTYVRICYIQLIISRRKSDIKKYISTFHFFLLKTTCCKRCGEFHRKTSNPILWLTLCCFMSSFVCVRLFFSRLIIFFSFIISRLPPYLHKIFKKVISRLVLVEFWNFI